MNEANYTDVYNEWSQQYEMIHQRPKLSRMYVQEAHWWDGSKGIIYTIIVLLGLFAGARTGAGVYDANVNEGFGGLLSAALAFIGVMGIEGTVAMFGLNRPRKLRHEGWVATLENSLGTASVLIGVFISALSGLNKSLSISPLLETRFGPSVEQWLSLSLGLGVTFMLYGFTEWAGRNKFVKENAPLFEQAQHDSSMAAYEDAKAAAWLESDAYWNVAGDERIAAEQARARAGAMAKHGARGMAGSLSDANRSFVLGDAGVVGAPSGDGVDKTQLVIAYVLDVYNPGDELPGPRPLAAEASEASGRTINPSSASNALRKLRARGAGW